VSAIDGEAVIEASEVALHLGSAFGNMRKWASPSAGSGVTGFSRQA
jgi:hypothetical protein